MLKALPESEAEHLASASRLPQPVSRLLATTLEHIADGRFQRSLSIVTAVSSLVSGVEVGYEHYKGSYSNRVMYTPVILSAVLAATAIAGFFNGRAARTVMRWTSILTLADGLIGFGFHIRGVHRKPGGWRLPVTNIVMGPPLFAPLLFGTAAYLGFIASFLRREEDAAINTRWTGNVYEDLSHGYFQKHLLVVTAAWSLFSGFEAWYSHYKNRFEYKTQWSPIFLTPLLIATCVAAIFSKRLSRTLLPAVSAITILDGSAGFAFHARGILRRPGGLRTWMYNIMFGPPIFAPLLFAACGTLGLLPSLLRREENT